MTIPEGEDNHENQDPNPEVNGSMAGSRDSDRGADDTRKTSPGSKKTEMGRFYRRPCPKPQKSETL